MRRREFITLLGSAAAAWPVAARAQQPAVPVIGYLGPDSPEEIGPLNLAAFRKGLSEMGYVEGRNVAIEFRWAKGQSDQFSALAADLVQRRVDVITATGPSPLWLAAKAATTTIPIVFQGGGDPVALELVASLNRPGGNITGFSNVTPGLTTKRLELLHKLVPNAATIAILNNPTGTNAQATARDLLAVASILGLHLIFLNVSSERDLEAAFASLVEERAGALLLIDNQLFNNRREQLVTLAARFAVPTIYTFREFATAGGLISYASSGTEAFRQTGVYTGRILKGEKPADLPVMLPTKFDLVINLKTARALGLTVPDTLLAIADEVIE
jgi:putative ABC transport system substrate-binding protein